MSGVVGREHRQPEAALLRRGVQLQRPDVAVAGAHGPWLRGVAGVLAVFWGVFFFGIVDLLAFLQGAEFHDTILLSTGWGLLFLFLVAGPLAVVCLGRT